MQWLGIALIIAATGYICAALGATWKRRRDLLSQAAAVQTSPVRAISVLKPLHGDEPNLYQNLLSFCLQTYPDYQIVFGVRAPDDTAIAIVRQLQKEFPRCPIELVIDPRVHGTNLKVSNLINMLPHAKHDWLVLADSDIGVAPDYLTRVTAPLAQPDVGIVTCLYHGIAGATLWSRLGRMFIDEWFVPSATLSHAFGSTRFAFGSTIALRREALLAIGSFETLRDTLADDFWLGELTRQHGLRTVLSEVIVSTDVNDSRFAQLWAHELRWLRTIRAIAPFGFSLTFVCFTAPLIVLGALLSPNPAALALAAVGALARVLLHFSQRSADDPMSHWHDVLLIPLRDGLLLIQWAVALTSWRVSWRGQLLHARSNGAGSNPSE